MYISHGKITQSLSKFIDSFISYFCWYLFIFIDKLQQKAFQLVGNAYTSIKADDFVVYMGMPANEAIEGNFWQLHTVHCTVTYKTELRH